MTEGLAALYAYESQIPEVSKTKREGLAAFYGIADEDATRFFSVHEEADVWHRQVEREALGRDRRYAGKRGEGARGGAALLRRAEPRARRRDAGERARLLTTIRAVFFDAGATLLYPDPPVEEVYARIFADDGARFTHGRAARRSDDDLDRGPAREAGRPLRRGPRRARVLAPFPRSRVRRLLDGGPLSDDAFARLAQHFREPGRVGRLSGRPAGRSTRSRRADCRSRSSPTGTRTCRVCWSSQGLAGYFRTVSVSAIEETGKPDAEIFRRTCAPRRRRARRRRCTWATRCATTTRARRRRDCAALLLDRRGEHRRRRRADRESSELPPFGWPRAAL